MLHHAPPVSLSPVSPIGRDWMRFPAPLTTFTRSSCGRNCSSRTLFDGTRVGANRSNGCCSLLTAPVVDGTATVAPPRLLRSPACKEEKLHLFQRRVCLSDGGTTEGCCRGECGSRALTSRRTRVLAVHTEHHHHWSQRWCRGLKPIGVCDCLFVLLCFSVAGTHWQFHLWLFWSRDWIEASQRVAPRKTLQRLKNTLGGATVDRVLLTAGWVTTPG